MAQYKKLKDSEDGEICNAFLTIGEEETRSSTDDDSTIVDRPLHTKGLHDGWCYSGAKAVILVLITLMIAFVAILLFSVWVVLHQRVYHESSVKHAHYQLSSNTGIVSNCGSTSAEAIAAGCHFDIFSFGWIPRECTDMQLYNESIDTIKSQAEGSPLFYRDKTPLPLSVIEDYATGVSSIMADGLQVYSTWEHYLVACTYGWQKVQRAAMRNWPLEEWSASYALAKRCGPDLLARERKESESILSHQRPWFPKCGLEAEDMRREIAAAL
ncbi:hypothetical protein CIMG_00466 [Paecilomyces variotii No. 5]|uniref:Uncharacterized protein n=1 Tax=Byssochlamys spectabilis (strain No. 5 / NBRC 109023) TaxID=1356009 RepID=V5FZF3_BYSSN|nr:hypothetical protein CIMG_00466 [Paecilomyces variotii No. 5]